MRQPIDCITPRGFRADEPCPRCGEGPCNNKNTVRPSTHLESIILDVIEEFASSVTYQDAMNISRCFAERWTKLKMAESKNATPADPYGHRAEAAKQEREIGVPVITGALGSAND